MAQVTARAKSSRVKRQDPARGMGSLGQTTWIFPAGFIPLATTGDEPEATSRDELFVLNTGPAPAALRMEVFFEDAPSRTYHLAVAAGRLRCIRMNDLIDPLPIPLATPYALVLRCDVPVVAALMRKDTSQAANALVAIPSFTEASR